MPDIMMKSPLLKSIENAERKTSPWEHFFYYNPLDKHQITEINNAEPPKNIQVFDGTRAGNNGIDLDRNQPSRLYVTKENSAQFPAMTRFIKDMMSEDTRKAFAKLIGRKDNFKDSYVRLEIIHDTKGFWLEPHCDIPEKLISSLVYINETEEDLNLGTDLYDEKLNLVSTVPFQHNLGYLFSGPNKWHGMERGKKIKVVRRGLQINYVTFKTDWKAN
jgi:hypothetical protein